MDMLKAVSTVFVVFVHAANIFDYANVLPNYWWLTVCKLFANCGVPIFFMVSGYLFAIKSTGYKIDIQKKIKTLCIPYFSWIFMYIFFETVGHTVFHDNFANVKNWSASEWIFNIFGVPFMSPPIYAPLWFVRDLFILNIVALWPRKIIERIPVSISVCVILLIWYLPLNGYLRQSVCFFLFGILIAVKFPTIVNTFTVTQKGIVLGGGGTALISLFLPEGHFYNPTKILLAVSMIFIVCQKWHSNKILQFGTYGFWIFATHGKLLSIFQILYTRVLPKTDLNTVIGYFILPILTICICVIIGDMLKKKLPQIYFYLTGGR